MRFFDLINSAKNSMFDAVNRFRNEDFLKAVIACCVLVATSDGIVDNNEKQKMLNFITGNESLKVFNIEEINQYFTHYISRLELDMIIGKAEALQAIKSIKSNSEQSELVIHVCIAIAKADGSISNQERNVISELITILGLNSNNFSY